MYKYLTYDEFCDNYKPIKNELVGYDQTHFETYGEEQDFVFAQDEKYVWTEVDGDGGCYIIAGKHFVNRIQYYVCEVPWDSDSQEVIVNVYKECDTCGCYGGYGTMDSGEDCPDCQDDHSLTIYPDSRKDIAEIIGEELANEQV